MKNSPKSYVRNPYYVTARRSWTRDHHGGPVLNDFNFENKKLNWGQLGLVPELLTAQSTEIMKKTPRKNVQKFNQRTRKKYLIIPNTLPALMASHRKLWDKNILYTCWNNKNLVKPNQSVDYFCPGNNMSVSCDAYKKQSRNDPLAKNTGETSGESSSQGISCRELYSTNTLKK